MENIDYVLLINVLIRALAVIIAGFVIPWIRSQISVNNYSKLLDTVETLVKAAEQLDSIQGGLLKDKFDYVKEGLEARGIVVDQEVIDMIESAVFDVNETTAKVQAMKLQHRDTLHS